VTLLAFAAERRAAAPLLLSADRAAIDRYFHCSPSAQQQTRSSGVRRENDGRRTDRRMPDRYIDPALRAAAIHRVK